MSEIRTPDPGLADFMNSLRAVFGMGPLYPRRNEQERDWLPAFQERGQVTLDPGGGGIAMRDGDGHAIKRFRWNWKPERWA